MTKRIIYLTTMLVILTIFVMSIITITAFSKESKTTLNKLHPCGVKKSTYKIKVNHGIKPISKTKLGKVNILEQLDLTDDFPNPGDQGYQGSCVGWAVGYSYKSYQEERERSWGSKTSDHIFSPSYIYNQINGGYDGGSYIEDALMLLVDKGCTTLNNMPYNQNDYTTQPTAQQNYNASQYKSLNAYYTYDYELIKQWMAENNDGAVIAIPVSEDFDYLNEVNDIYDVYDSDSFRGYHALSIIGYDDNKQAFKIINSWGSGWGIEGYGWIDYDFITNQSCPMYVMEDVIGDYPSPSPSISPSPSLSPSKPPYNPYLLFNKFKELKNKGIGHDWEYWVRSNNHNGKLLKKNKKFYTHSSKVWLKALEYDYTRSDYSSKTVYLKKGTNNIKLRVYENNNRHNKYADVQFTIFRK